MVYSLNPIDPHCGISFGYSKARNKVDLACKLHDKQYEQISKRGFNPYRSRFASYRADYDFYKKMSYLYKKGYKRARLYRSFFKYKHYNQIQMSEKVKKIKDPYTWISRPVPDYYNNTYYPAEDYTFAVDPDLYNEEKKIGPDDVMDSDLPSNSGSLVTQDYFKKRRIEDPTTVNQTRTTGTRLFYKGKKLARGSFYKKRKLFNRRYSTTLRRNGFLSSYIKKKKQIR